MAYCGLHGSAHVSTWLHVPQPSYRHGLVRLEGYEVGLVVMRGIGCHLECIVVLQLPIYSQPFTLAVAGDWGR